jgi:isopenicillin-N epimerase
MADPRTISRRDFLVAGGALAALAALPQQLLADTAPPALDVSTWEKVRAQFALAPDLLHFSSFYIASHPRPVREAIEAYRKAIDADPYETVEHALVVEPLQRKVCEHAAAYLGGAADEIALVGNTTTGLALVYHGLPLAAGDEVLTTTHDHYSQDESIRFAAARSGASVRRVALYDRAAETTTADVVARLRAALRPETRVVGVTWVHSGTGVRLPVRAIADVIAEANRSRDEAARIRLVVDGVHGLGCVDERVTDLGCDFFCAGTHKWLFAPRGTGLVWGRAAEWARMRPVVPSFSNMAAFGAWIEGAPPSAVVTAADFSPGGFAAYEHQWAMAAAFRFHEAIGRAKIAERIATLNDQCKAGLARIRGVTVHTPRSRERSAGLVAFEVAGVSSEDVVKRLREKHIVASTAPYKVSYARLAPSLVNTPHEVDVAVEAVKSIAKT